MPDSDLPRTSVSLAHPTDVPAALREAGIDHVGVHEQRLLAIYGSAIFNVTTDAGSLSSTTEIVIACWERPTTAGEHAESAEAPLEELVHVFATSDRY